MALAEETAVIAGLVGVQAIYGLYMVFLNGVLELGLSVMFLIVCGNLATALLLLPFALALEQEKWPKRFTPSLLAYVVLIALGGITSFQSLMFYGIKKTSPAIASAMPNLAPGFIFVIAACLRFENIDMSCKYSRVKISGTLVCLAGAVAMSLLQTPPVASSITTIVTLQKVGLDINKEWMTGCMYLLVAVLTLSCTTVLQAVVMKEFPVPISLCVATSFVGAVLTALAQIIVEGKLDAGSTVADLTSIISVVLLGTTVSSVCVTFQTWCISKKGPVFVSMFSPIQTVCSALLSMIILGQTIGIGSLIGMLLMFSGLYIVLWAKKKETFNVHELITSITEEDIEKPLLS